MDYTVYGTYGRGTACSVHCYSTWGGTWYAVEGSHNVNFCNSVVLGDGVDVELIEDDDTFTSAAPICDSQDIVSQVMER